MEKVVFKRWRNKKWAILASFHKVIAIGTLCVSYNILAQDISGGQQDSSKIHFEVELEEVEALGDSPYDLDNISLKSLMLVSSREIFSAPVSSHEDLLEYLPQVDIRNRGKFGTQADLNIQGGSFDQSMVLLNGINLSDPQTGHFHLNLPVDISAVRQVEVFAGSAARRFGTHALSGAVNFITKPGDSTSIQSGFRYGQHNFYKAFLNSNLKGENISTLASISSSGSDGYQKNTDFRTTNVFLHSSTKPGKLNADVMVGLNSRAFGANSFYSPRFLDQYEETTTGMAALKMALHRPKSTYSINAYLRMNKDYFLLNRHDPSFYRNDHLTRVAGMELNGVFSSVGGVTQSGIVFRREAILSTSLGEPREISGTTTGNNEIDFNHGHVRNQLNWNIQHTMEWRWISLQGGVLLHLNSDLGSDLYALPGLDISFRLPQRIRLMAALNRSMRLPTFTDLYYQGPTNLGNPDLAPEKATTFEAGISRNGEAFQAALNGFYRQGRDLIDWIWMEVDEKWHTLNLTKIDAIGGDFHLGYAPVNSANSTLSFRKWDLTYTFSHLTYVSDEFISRYLLDNLKHKIVLSTNLTLIKNLALTVRLNFQDRNGSFLQYDSDSGQSTEKPYEPYLLVDSKLIYSFGRFHIFLESTNILNVIYNDIGNVIQPGRWTIAGIKIR